MRAGQASIGTSERGKHQKKWRKKGSHVSRSRESSFPNIFLYEEIEKDSWRRKSFFLLLVLSLHLRINFHVVRASYEHRFVLLFAILRFYLSLSLSLFLLFAFTSFIYESIYTFDLSENEKYLRNLFVCLRLHMNGAVGTDAVNKLRAFIQSYISYIENYSV